MRFVTCLAPDFKCSSDVYLSTLAFKLPNQLDCRDFHFVELTVFLCLNCQSVDNFALELGSVEFVSKAVALLSLVQGL